MSYWRFTIKRQMPIWLEIQSFKPALNPIRA